MKLDDIRMLNLVQESYLSESPLGVSGVLKSIEYFFQSYHSFRLFIQSFPYMAISPRAHLSYKFISQEDVLLNLLGHILNYLNILIISILVYTQFYLYFIYSIFILTSF